MHGDQRSGSVCTRQSLPDAPHASSTARASTKIPRTGGLEALVARSPEQMTVLSTRASLTVEWMTATTHDFPGPPLLVIHQRVADYAKWRPVYDAHKSARDDANWQRHVVCPPFGELMGCGS